MIVHQFMNHVHAIVHVQSCTVYMSHACTDTYNGMYMYVVEVAHSSSSFLKSSSFLER